MRVIYKYPLTFAAGSRVSIPEGAKLLCVQVQRGDPCLWALVDTDLPAQPRTLVIFGTGHEIPAELPVAYIDTFQVEGGALVFHVFEVLPP